MKVCMNCGSDGRLVDVQQHSALKDNNYECTCGAKWTYITEGERKHRYQLEYPRRSK